MAQPLQQVSLSGMGFQGLNTELSPINSTAEFALVADNFVIDEVGRLGAREAFADLYPAMGTQANSFVDITAMSAWYGGSIEDPSPVVVCCTSEYKDTIRSKIDRQFSEALNISKRETDPAKSFAYSLSWVDDGEMQAATHPDLDTTALDTALFVHFKEELLLFSKGNPPIKYDGNGGFTKISAMPDYTSPEIDGVDELNGDVACSAYGRLWVSGVNDDYQAIYYSSLLREDKWYDPDLDTGFNDGGLINVQEYWPVEGDYIVNIHAHNGFLFVFGRRSILIYANASKGDPADDATGFGLQDAISNVGLVERDAICNTGTDILFVDDTGLRSIGRVVQEKSNPVAEASLNVTTDFVRSVGKERLSASVIKGIRLNYEPSRAIAVCLFRSTDTAYVFSTTSPSSTGGLMVTFWNGCTFNCMYHAENSSVGKFWLGGTESKGILEYKGYKSIDSYTIRWESSVVKQTQVALQKVIPRSIIYMLNADPVAANCYSLWGFGSKMAYRREFALNVIGSTEWNVAEYDIDEYSGGDKGVWRSKINTMGSGEFMRVGLEIDVSGFFVGLQDIAVNYSTGRIVA